jgi:4-amino-4-deoxy-L-arabinose transferase-like glycosyltransferase
MPSHNTAKSDNIGRTVHISILCAVLVALGGMLLAISQSPYAYGDEGFHLLASQLLNVGKRPYLDFFYQHTPLYIYFNGVWMRLFGDTWQSAHALSALLITACAAMLAGFLFSRFHERKWRLAAAISGTLMFASNILVTRFGVLGQPYALCLFFLFSAFLLTLRTINQTGFSALWAGLFSGAAVASSLLTAIVAPLLFLWTANHVPRVDRRKKCIQFATGTVVALLPVFWLSLQGPRQAFFNLVGYHFLHRKLGRGQGHSILFHDLKTVTAWLDSTQGLLLGLLALVGVAFFLSGQRKPDDRLRTECQLCGLIALCLSAYLCLPHPTFPQYFILLIPFLTILAASGLYAIGTQMYPRVHPIWLMLITLALFGFEGAKSVRQQVWSPESTYSTWSECEQIAQLINRVIPQNCPIYCDDGAVYFAAKRIPPSGLENNYSFSLNLPPDLAERLHILPQREIDNLVAKGHFGSVIAWSPMQAESLRLRDLYKNEKDFHGHLAFWDLTDTSHQPCY